MGALLDSAPVLWYEADTITDLVGSTVVSWDVTAGNPVTLNAPNGHVSLDEASTPSGLPSVRLDGSGVLNQPTATANTDIVTYAAVFKVTGDATTSRTLVGDSAVAGGGLQWKIRGTGQSDPNKQQLNKQLVSNYVMSSTALVNDEWVVVIAEFSSQSSASFTRDGVADGSAASSTDLTAGSGHLMQIGRAGGSGEWFTGSIAALVRWNRVLTSQEKAAVTAELTAKWITGITTNTHAGADTPSAVYVGADLVDAIYVGSDKVWG